MVQLLLISTNNASNVGTKKTGGASKPLPLPTAGVAGSTASTADTTGVLTRVSQPTQTQMNPPSVSFNPGTPLRPADDHLATTTAPKPTLPSLPRTAKTSLPTLSGMVLAQEKDTAPTLSLPPLRPWKGSGPKFNDTASKQFTLAEDKAAASIPEHPVNVGTDAASFFILKDKATEKGKDEGWYIDGPITLEDHGYALRDLTDEDLSPKTEYIENPYEPGEYLKKVSTIELLKAGANQTVSIGKPKLQSTDLTLDAIKNRFIASKSYEEDGLAALRGPVVGSSIFSSMRKQALLDTINDFMADDTRSLIGSDTAYGSGNSLLNVYNLAKAAIELASQEERASLSFAFPARALTEPKDLHYRAILIRAEAVNEKNRLPLSDSEIYSAPKRPLIERLVSADRYPLERNYIKAYGSVVREARALDMAKDAIPNPNGFIMPNSRAALDNTSAYVPYTMHVPNLAANALREFLQKGHGTALDIHVAYNVLKSVKDNDRSVSAFDADAHARELYPTAMLKPLGETVAYEEAGAYGSDAAPYYKETDGVHSYVAPEDADDNETYYTKERYSIEALLDRLLLVKDGQAGAIEG